MVAIAERTMRSRAAQRADAEPDCRPVDCLLFTGTLRFGGVSGAWWSDASVFAARIRFFAWFYTGSDGFPRRAGGARRRPDSVEADRVLNARTSRRFKILSGNCRR